MTTTHTNLALVEGEVHIFSESGATECDYLNIIASTKYIENVPQLDRKHFVKPKVDFMEKGREIYDNSHMDLTPDFLIGYRFGYTDHEKEAEFTREEMEMFWVYAKSDNYTFDEAINKLRPLCLPKSVTLNENNEVIYCQW